MGNDILDTNSRGAIISNSIKCFFKAHLQAGLYVQKFARVDALIIET